MKKMDDKIIERIVRSYERMTDRLNEERKLYDVYCDRPQYGDFGLAVKESYLEYVNEVKYDE